MNVFELQGSIGLNTQQYDQGLERAKQGTESLSSFVIAKGQLIAGALEKAGAALSKLGQSIVTIGSGFETSFAKVQTIMDTSVKSAETMNAEIKELSSGMGVSFSELADTVYNAISATGDTANAVQMAASASKLATAGFTDTGSALSVLTTAMNAYGISAERVTDISDSLITVQNLGVTTVSELASTMGKGIASASAYGVNLINLESAYIALTKAGISTNESTTYISSMMKELGDEGSKVGEILQNKTGKSFAELMSSGKSLGQVLEILYNYCGQDSAAFMNLWSSAEAGKAASAVAGQGFDNFEQWLDALRQSTGATEQAFETMAGTFEHKAAVMKTTAQNLAADVFNSMKDGLGGAVEQITEMLNGIGDVFNGNESGGIARIRNAISGISDIIAQESPRIISVITEILNGIMDAIGQSAPSIINAAQTLIMSLINGINSNLPHLIQSATMIVQAIVNGLTQAMPQLIPAAMLIIQNLISGLSQSLPQLLSYAPQIINMLCQALAQNVDLIVQTAVNCAVIVVNALIQNLPQILTSLANAIGDGFISIIKSIFTGGSVDTSGSMMQLGSGMSQYMAQGFSQGASVYFPQAMSGAIGTMQTSMAQFSTAAEQVGGGGGTAFATGFGRTATQGVQTAGQQTESALSTTYAQIETTAQTAGTETANAYGQGLAQIDNTSEQAMQGVASSFEQSCSSINASMQNVDSETLSHLNSMVQNFVNAGNSFASAMNSAFGSVNTAANSGMVNVNNNVLSVLQNMVSNFQNYGGQMANAIGTSMQQIASAVSQQLQTVTNTVSTWGTQIVNQFKTIGSQIVQGMIQGISSGQSGLNAAISSMVNQTVGQTKEGLGIHSPSRLFRDEIGANITAGIAEGIDMSAFEPMNAIGRLNDNMVAEMAGGYGGIDQINALLERYLPNMGGDTYLDGDRISYKVADRVDRMLGGRAVRKNRGGAK